MSSLQVVRHSAVADALRTIRSRETSTVEFRAATRLIARALAYEGTRSLPVEAIEIDTPMERAAAEKIAAQVVAIPILRAGLGLLDGFLDIIPAAATGFVGLRRNELTLEPDEYYRNVPDLAGAHVFLLDPMLATGGSIRAALRSMPLEGAASVHVLSIIAAPEGVRAVADEFPGVTMVVASLDRCLNTHGYILPGLGDAGDRLCQTL
jgi:uracil phosphoribosyltransferase